MIELNVAVKSPGVLGITLLVKSPQPVVVDQHSLPWGGRYNGFLLVAADADSNGETLPAQAAFEEPMEYAEVTLQPGKPLTGAMHLENRVQDVLKVLRKKDLLVFWSYQFRAQDGVMSNRVGGWLMMPRLGGVH